MGHRNWKLVSDLEEARKAGRTEEAARLALQLEESQRGCPHPDQDKLVSPALEDFDSKNRGPIKKGDTLVTCQACSYIIRHIPKR